MKSSLIIFLQNSSLFCTHKAKKFPDSILPKSFLLKLIQEKIQILLKLKFNLLPMPTMRKSFLLIFLRNSSFFLYEQCGNFFDNIPLEMLTFLYANKKENFP